MANKFSNKGCHSGQGPERIKRGKELSKGFGTRDGVGQEVRIQEYCEVLRADPPTSYCACRFLQGPSQVRSMGVWLVDANSQK